jgi:hypothetical protein
MTRTYPATLVLTLAILVTVGGHPQPAAGETSAAPTVAEAKAYAKKRLGAAQWQCFDAIARRESHWNPLAHNARSGAHGIGQAVPWTKMRRFGPDAYRNPLTQVKWMIAYVDKYGGPCGAWAFWQQNHWY